MVVLHILVIFIFDYFLWYTYAKAIDRNFTVLKILNNPVIFILKLKENLYRSLHNSTEQTSIIQQQFLLLPLGGAVAQSP